MKKLLLIEDNEDNIYLTEYLLQAAGYTVVVARTGGQGLTRALCDTYDLIIMDMQLPDTDGFQVTRELRTRPEMRDTPIVAVTSLAMPGDRKRALDAGCTGYIEKPIDPERFVHQLECAAQGEATDPATGNEP